MMGINFRKLLFLTLLAACAFPVVNTAHALIAGILFSLLFGNPWPQKSSDWSKKLLQLSVVGLGFGLSITQVWQVGKSSVLYTIVGISLTLIVGLLLGRFFKIKKNTSTLISFGTAICGGSAIAAMSPVINAEDDEAAMALVIVFILNAVALLTFPFIGHFLHLSQLEFGLWAGLAIHDTSSVVGAAATYGSAALATGTTVKLARAIWIIPFVMGAAWITNSEKKAKFPLFIVGFIVAAAIHTLLPQFGEVWAWLATLAKQTLVITLFLIGAGLTKETLKKVGIRPMAQGISLWLLVSGLTLVAILHEPLIKLIYQ